MRPRFWIHSLTCIYFRVFFVCKVSFEMDPRMDVILRSDPVCLVSLEVDGLQALKQKNAELQQEVDELKQEKKKYEAMLATSQENHEQRILLLSKENALLRDQVERITKENDELSNQIALLKKEIALLKQESECQQKMEKEMRILLAEKQKNDDILLLGLLGYNVIEATLQFVFGKDQLRERRKKLRSIEAIRNAQKTQTQQECWAAFEQKWKEEWDDVVEELTGEKRVSIAHPVSVDPDDPERVATPKEVCAVVGRVYQARKHKEMRELTLALVDFMSSFHREAGRDFLE